MSRHKNYMSYRVLDDNLERKLVESEERDKDEVIKTEKVYKCDCNSFMYFSHELEDHYGLFEVYVCVKVVEKLLRGMSRRSQMCQDVQTVYKIFLRDRENSLVKNLFKGIKRNRTMPADKWIRAENRWGEMAGIVLIIVQAFIY